MWNYLDLLFRKPSESVSSCSSSSQRLALSLPKPIRLSDPVILIPEPEPSSPEPAIVLDESPECVSDSSSELVEIKESPHPRPRARSEDDTVEVVDTSSTPLPNPSKKTRGIRILSESSCDFGELNYGLPKILDWYPLIHNRRGAGDGRRWKSVEKSPRIHFYSRVMELSN